MSLGARLRRELGTRRHRLLTASIARLEDRLGDRVDLAQSSLEQRLEALEQRHAALEQRTPPQLWNDLERDPAPPLPMPSSLLREAATESPLAVIEALLADAPGPQGAELRRFGAEAVFDHAERDRCPVPVPQDREGYFGDRHLEYWLSGLGDCLWFEELLQAHGVPRDGARILDLGASSGRMSRHVVVREWASTLYGFDVQPQAVRWMNRHLPDVTAAMTTVIPSLPLPEGAVDAIYCGSLFTHVDEFEGALLLELRRVLRPGGVAVVTIHPERVWTGMQGDEGAVLRDWLLGRRNRMDPPGVDPVTEDTLREPMPADRVVFRAVELPEPNTNVIHSHDWIRQRWAPLFEICAIVPYAHGDHQDAVVLRRR